MIDKLYSAGFTIDGIIWVAMLAVCALAAIGNEVGQ